MAIYNKVDLEEPIFGNRMADRCGYNAPDTLYMIPGTGKNGNRITIPVGKQLLSRHMLFLGGIGTGKTNAMNLFIRNTRGILKENDVVIIRSIKSL